MCGHSGPPLRQKYCGLIVNTNNLYNIYNLKTKIGFEIFILAHLAETRSHFIKESLELDICLILSTGLTICESSTCWF